MNFIVHVSLNLHKRYHWNGKVNFIFPREVMLGGTNLHKVYKKFLWKSLEWEQRLENTERSFLCVSVYRTHRLPSLFSIVVPFFRKHCLVKQSRFRLRARSELNPVFRRVQLDSEEFPSFIHVRVQSVYYNSFSSHSYFNICFEFNRRTSMVFFFAILPRTISIKKLRSHTKSQ